MLGEDNSLASASIAAGDDVTDWQPIETAPDDGTEVLVAYPNGVVTIGSHRTGRRGRDGYGPVTGYDWHREDYAAPSHWMPKPPPPTTTKEPKA